MKYVPPSLEALANICARFNANNPVGTPVLYHPVIGEAAGKLTRTRSEAFILSGHTAVVFVESVAGCVALDAVEVLPL